jgi:hypothetical protein
MEQMQSRESGTRVSTAGAQPRRRSCRPTVVVLDAGPKAWVATRELAGEIGLGSRFSYNGTIWQVVSYRSHARAYIAEPVAS